MSTTRGNLASHRGIMKMEDQPDRLLVLVHGIFARYQYSCTPKKVVGSEVHVTSTRQLLLLVILVLSI